MDHDTMLRLLDAINAPLGTALVVMLGVAGLWFTVRTGAVQFRMLGEMVRLLFESNSKAHGKHISSFQAFNVSLASRIGTGNLAGVATAIAVGGPGAVFWMWIMALIGAASAFIESTLAQLFKEKGRDSFVGGPAYYITKGMGRRWFAVIFAVSLIIVFGWMNNMVQSNTISLACRQAFGIDTVATGVVLTLLSLVILFGGIQRIARVSSAVVPLMALVYLGITVYIFAVRHESIPEVFGMIVTDAFGWHQAAGGAVGTAIMMGFKRGLFSNEAGQGSAPNVAATAAVTHPVKQGLIQALGVFTDTLLVCSCTAFIILCSGLYSGGANGIALTQQAIDAELGGGWGSRIVAVLIFFFGFSSVIGNYYYGESNIRFLTTRRWVLPLFRLSVGAVVMVGAVMALEVVWGTTDIFMTIMTACNLVALASLGKYAVRALADYRSQRRRGLDPQYYRSAIPEIADRTECWPDRVAEGENSGINEGASTLFEDDK